MKKLLVGFWVLFMLGTLSCKKDEIFDADAQLETDIALIEGYLSSNALEADTLLPSEIRIIIHQQGRGEKGDFGTSVQTNYKGYYLNNETFDSTGVDSPPLTFVIDRGDVVPGWDVAFKELAKGAKATIFLPSSQGYGNQPNGGIPANTVLVFDVDVVEMR